MFLGWFSTSLGFSKTLVAWFHDVFVLPCSCLSELFYGFLLERVKILVESEISRRGRLATAVVPFLGV